MSDICDHCGMPSAICYVLATAADGTVLLSHLLCDACAMVFGQEAAESSDDETPIQTDAEFSDSDSD